jgi:hypothetical protein
MLTNPCLQIKNPAAVKLRGKLSLTKAPNDRGGGELIKTFAVPENETRLRQREIQLRRHILALKPAWGVTSNPLRPKKDQKTISTKASGR